MRVFEYNPIMSGDEDEEFFTRIVKLYEEYDGADEDFADDLFMPFRSPDQRYAYLYHLVGEIVYEIENV